MENNIFYKALASVSTVGIVAIGGLLVPIANQKGNNIEESVANTRSELIQARKAALDEIKAARKGALAEVKTAKKESLNAINKAGGQEGTVWLVLVGIGKSIGGGVGIEKIEMQNMGQCELQGAMWASSERLSNNKKARNVRYECITGK